MLLAAPALNASEEQIEEWLESYNTAIKAVDSEAAAAEAAAAAPADGPTAEAPAPGVGPV